MQSSTRNPIQRPLPDGWIEHFDSQRNLWYYVDLNSDPPRVTLVHPSELDDKHPSSAPAKSKDHGQARNSPVPRPIGPRQSASSSSSIACHTSQRPRRSTVAQQLYASSLTVGPKNSLLATTISENSSQTSSHSPSGPSPVSDNIVSNSSSSTTAYPSSSSGSSSTRVSPTSPAPTSPSKDLHNPRNFLDYTRLSGTRRVTYSGPQPCIGPRSSGETLAPGSAGSHHKVAFGGADAFYPGSVKTSPSSLLPKSASQELPDNHLHLPALPAPKSHQMKAALNSGKLPSSSESSAVRPHILITATSPSHVAPSVDTSIEPFTLTPDETLTENRYRRDDSQPSKTSSELDGSNSSARSANVRPLPSTKPPSRNNSSLTSEGILQPKPIRPLAGVSLNLQVQVAGVQSESSPDQLVMHQEFVSKKKKNPLLQNLTLSLSKNAKGKTPIRTIYDRQLLSSSPVIDDFAL